MLPLRFCTFGILSLWNESYPVSQLCHYVILKPQILAGLFFCPFVGGITCDRMLGSGFYMLGDGTVFLCVFLYFVLGCSWILSGFALKLLVRARGHLSNSTMARDFTNDGMVPSVLLVALFQPQWLTHRLAPIIHCEESEFLCLQVCRHCHLSTIYLPAPLPLLRPTSCFTLFLLCGQRNGDCRGACLYLSVTTLCLSTWKPLLSHINFPVIFSFSTWEVDSVSCNSLVWWRLQVSISIVFEKLLGCSGGPLLGGGPRQDLGWNWQAYTCVSLHVVLFSCPTSGQPLKVIWCLVKCLHYSLKFMNVFCSFHPVRLVWRFGDKPHAGQCFSGRLAGSGRPRAGVQLGVRAATQEGAGPA